MQNLNLKLFTILILTITIIGCSSNKKTEDEYLKEAQTKFDNKQYDSAVVIYKEFIKNYPKSDKALFAYNQIAGIYIENLNNSQEAINTYKELADKFPNSKEAKQALFMIAFIYDETLKDKDNAIKSYKIFLEKYPKDNDPNDKMSESARTMLEVLQSGKSIDEIIQQNIDKMNKEQPKTDSIKIDVKKVDPSQQKMKKENPGKKEDPNIDKKTKE